MSSCTVCERPHAETGVMCPACSRAYDRLTSKDSTTIGLIEWVAKRARAALRKKLKTRTP